MQPAERSVTTTTNEERPSGSEEGLRCMKLENKCRRTVQTTPLPKKKKNCMSNNTTEREHSGAQDVSFMTSLPVCFIGKLKFIRCLFMEILIYKHMHMNGNINIVSITYK